MITMDELDTVVRTSVAPHAAEVDAEGAYPKAALEALREAGVLGATVPEQFGGAGLGLAGAAEVVRRLAGACGSTAMIVTMHYAATAVLAADGRAEVLAEIAAGRHLTTLAFSEAGSRSHFWAPLGTATADGDRVALTARKSWVTAAAEVDSYVWSSRPVEAEGPMSLWLVPARTPGVEVAGGFDGLGLRGNGSRPVAADAALVPREALIGADGAGLELALASALPWFLLGSAAAGVGTARAVTTEAIAHLTATSLEHLGEALADQPAHRHRIARMHIQADSAAAFLEGTLRALDAGRPEAQLLVLETKALVDQTALEVTDLAMAACGGAAFRKELGIERRFRDARAARIMAPTTDALHDFVGRAVCGRPLLGA
jgi:isovaleryl-CoA dehydrogenase